MRVSALVFTALAGCSSTTASPPAASDGGSDASPREYAASVVRELTYTNDKRSFPVQLVRIERPDGGRTYVQWIRQSQPGPRATVLSTDPYGGITWSGEDVDGRWAGRADGIYEDTEQADYDGNTKIVYQPTTVDSVNEQEFMHLYNGANVLRVHGRFYTGGNLADDVEDMKAGMWFLANQPEVDPRHVGVFGGSWGGFEALYASAFGDRRVAPLVTVAMYPAADFGAWLDHAETRMDPAKSFLRGYVKRVRSVSKGSLAEGGNFKGFTFEDLCPGLPEATFVLQDEADNLVPVSQGKGVIQKCGGDLMLWPRAAPAQPSDGTHGPLLTEGTSSSQHIPAVYTYGMTYLHMRLLTGPLLEAVERSSMLAHLQGLKEAQKAGKDVSYAAPRLRELCDARITLFEGMNGTLVPIVGAELVAQLVNQVWGTSLTAANVAETLKNGLPAGNYRTRQLH